MRFDETMPQIAAGMGFGLAIEGSVLRGYGIAVPNITNPTGVWAGAVAVVAHGDQLTAFVRRPSDALEAMVAKFNTLTADWYVVQSVSVSDRAIGAIGLTQYGYKLVVVGYDGLPHQSQVSDLLVATGDESFTPSEGEWFIAVKSPRLWNVASTPVLTNGVWVYGQGWRAPLTPYQVGDLEWHESDDCRGESLGVYADYLVSQYEGFIHFSSSLTEGKYQRRYMPIREDWLDVDLGHQCGIGRTVDGVYFWGTQPQ